MPRNFKISLLLLIILLAGINVFAQMGTPVDSATVNAVMKQCAIKYPKFYREFNDIKAHDKLIKNFVFVRYTTDTGPAKAGPRAMFLLILNTWKPNSPILATTG